MIMKTILLGAMLCAGVCGYAQQNYFYRSISYSNDKKLDELMRFMGVEYYEVEISTPTVKNKPLLLWYEEYVDGKMVGEVAITPLPQNSAYNIFTCHGDTAKFKLMSKEEEGYGRVSVSMPGFSFDDKLKTETACLGYNMFELAGNARTGKVINGKKREALFAYSQPFDKKPGKYHCTTMMTDVPVTQWGQKYGLKHYYVFYVQVG
jgi:hypothetical protein